MRRKRILNPKFQNEHGHDFRAWTRYVLTFLNHEAGVQYSKVERKRRKQGYNITMDFFPKANYTKHLHMIDTSSKKNLIWHKRRPEILLDIKKKPFGIRPQKNHQFLVNFLAFAQMGLPLIGLEKKLIEMRANCNFINRENQKGKRNPAPH